MTPALWAALAAVAVAQSFQVPGGLVPVVDRGGGPAYARKPTSEEKATMAAEIERRLEGLDRRLKDENSAFDREAHKLAALNDVVDAYPPDSPEVREAKVEMRRILELYPKAPIFLEMTLLARRLQIYKETGELPPDIPDREAIRKLLDNPWERVAMKDPTREVVKTFALEKDIARLEKQIARYARLAGPKLAAQPAAPKAEPLPPTPPAPPRLQAPAPPKPELAEDAGLGREEIDPIPRLLEQLVSADARQRALAADELGRHGEAARPGLHLLTLALSDPQARVRASAALALGGLGPLPQESMAALEAARQDKSDDVRFSAKAALQRLKPSR
ncbi:MAG: HEAT repeat domain-containing protein [Elusimicrobia bacterium]|nr:HEAT repeat domain-containing protein [Elusimicrobiota bacterium]